MLHASRLATCLAAALVLTACSDDGDDLAPSTDTLIERSAGDMATPTDAAAVPLDLDSLAESERVGEPVTPSAPSADDPERPPPPVTPPTRAQTAEPASPPAAQPETGGSSDEADAAALWTAFRAAVASRDASAIERLIADPVRLNGQLVPHSEFAEMTPGGSVSDFVTTFEGELATTDALAPAPSGGYQALATARAEDTESALIFRLAPDADGTWRIVAIDAAG